MYTSQASIINHVYFSQARTINHVYTLQASLINHVHYSSIADPELTDPFRTINNFAAMRWRLKIHKNCEKNKKRLKYSNEIKDLKKLPRRSTKVRQMSIFKTLCWVRKGSLETVFIHAQSHTLFLVACTRLYDPLCPSVGPSDGRSFFSLFYVVLSYSKSLYILSFDLDDRRRLRGVGLVIQGPVILFSEARMF